MTKTQENRLNKINQLVTKNDVTKNDPAKANKILAKAEQYPPLVYIAIRESFEKNDIQLTTDNLAKGIKNQVTYLKNIQQKVEEANKLNKFPNPKLLGIAAYSSRILLEWVKLIFQLRGDLHEAKMQVAQQVNIHAEREYKLTFEDFVIQSVKEQVEP